MCINKTVYFNDQNIAISELRTAVWHLGAPSSQPNPFGVLVRNTTPRMPKHRRKILRRTVPIKVNRDILQRQLTCVQKDKENSLSTITEGSGNDPLLSYMVNSGLVLLEWWVYCCVLQKIEVKEELDSDQQLELSEEINIPLKIEEFETLDYDRYSFH